MQIGRRLEELRRGRHVAQSKTAFSHSWLWKVEKGRQEPSIGAVERLCDYYGIGLQRFFGDWDTFQSMLALEDELVIEVLPYLKRLSIEQRKQILTVLEAAPKQDIHKGGRPRSADTGSQTLNVSKNSTAGKVSTMPCRTLPIQSSQFQPLPKTKAG